MRKKDVLAVPVDKCSPPGPADDIREQRAAHRSGDADDDHQAEIEVALRTSDDRTCSPVLQPVRG